MRTSATKTLVTVKIFAGPSKRHTLSLGLSTNRSEGVKDLIEDLNPQLLNTITSEFDKAEGQSPPEPTRVSADLANFTSESGGGGGPTAAAGGADPLDELFPRVDLDGLFKGTTILTDAKSDAWKTKKEALESLQAILDQGSNKRLKPNMGMSSVFSPRLSDSQPVIK